MMKKVLSTLLVCLMVSMLYPAFPVLAQEEPPIPTEGLDLWLEADFGVETDDSEIVTSWASKINGLNKDVPYVLNQLSTASGAGYTAPKVHQTLNGQSAVYFNGKSLATENFTAYENNDEMTLFLLTKPIRENTERNEVSYLVQNGADNVSGIFINRKTDGVYEAKDGKGRGHAFVKTPTDYTVMTIKAQQEDGKKYFYFYQNNEQEKKGEINGSLGMTKYRLGHRSDDEVAAFLIYQRALSADEQTKVYDYLYQKYIAMPIYPIMQSGSINAAGTVITLTADSALSGACSAEDFQVTVGGTAAIPAAAAVNADGKVELTLSEAVTYGQTVQVSYTGTTLINSSGNALEFFENLSVDVNAIPVPEGQKPVIVKAAASIKGDMLELTADLNLSGEPSPTEFQVEGAASGTMNIKTVRISGKNIILELTAPLSYKENAVVSYTGSSIVSAADNGVMEPFESKTVVPYTLENIPQDGLDLWLEADAGVLTDASGNVTSWTSKVNGLGKNTPYVLDKLSTANDAGYAPPTVRKTVTGQPAVYFNGKSLETAGFTPYNGDGEMTMFILTKFCGENNARSRVSYLVQNGEEKDKNGIYINRIEGEKYELKDGNGVGQAFVAPPDGYTVLTVTAKKEDGQRYFYLHQNNKQEKRVAFNAPIDMTKFRLGHRADDEVAAFMIYQRAVSDVERDSIYQYLYEKYVMESQFTMQDIAVTYKTTDGGASAEAVAGGSAEITGSIINNSVQAVNAARGICGSFDNSIMEDIGIFDFNQCTLGRVREFTFNIKLPQNLDHSELRLFLWDGFENVRPLMKSQTITLSNITE